MVVVLAIVAGAVQFGRLQGQIEGLDTEVIREERDEALRQIDRLRDRGLTMMEELIVSQRGTVWIDTKDERTGGCVDGASGTQYCPATNDLGYPVTVAVVTVNRHRPNDTPGRGCGVAIHMVEGTPDWHTPRAEEDAADLVLAHMVTGDPYGVCWAAATLPAGSDYYGVNAYRPHVDIVSWSQLI